MSERFATLDKAQRRYAATQWSAGQGGTVAVRAAHPGQIRMFAVVLGILGVLSIWFLINLVATRLSTGLHSFGDFPALWSYGRIQLTHPAALLYDFEGLHTAQVALGMEAKWHYPFPYPPSVLFLLRPFGLLSYETALPTWISLQMVFYLWAVLGDDGNPAIDYLGQRPVRLAMAAALLLAPTAALTIVEGQSGFLAAGLLIGGIRRARARPLLGGILLGLLSYKPQLGLLVPVALLAACWWRCAAFACLTIVVLVVTTSQAFGWNIWLLWIQSLPTYQAWFTQTTNGMELMPTVTANLSILGAPDVVAQVAQIAVALGAACATWRCFRRGCPMSAIAALVVATCLANPHAFVYDLPMLDASVVLLAAQRLRGGAGFTAIDLLLMLTILWFPTSMVVITMPFGSIILAAFLAMIMTQRLRTPTSNQILG